ncbi:unnamed protein product [Prorocentrum cordatum]|uniref:Subtilisin n=1 Tax=Prorocentrum cordatum TaxID=2364126 RepID=A0ABN9RWL7_9DINO|nr:unnamed protein product [Polarella glacialis]
MASDGALDAVVAGAPTLGGNSRRRPVATLASGYSVFAALMAHSEVSQKEYRGSDARTLAVVDVAAGTGRPRSSASVDCQEEAIADIGAKPSRSDKWCVAYQLKDAGVGAREHETQGKIVETRGSTSQVDTVVGDEIVTNRLSEGAAHRAPLGQSPTRAGSNSRPAPSSPWMRHRPSWQGGQSPSSARPGLLDCLTTRVRPRARGVAGLLGLRGRRAPGAGAFEFRLRLAPLGGRTAAPSRGIPRTDRPLSLQSFSRQRGFAKSTCCRAEG